jgi:glutathionylspermidine synthase
MISREGGSIQLYQEGRVIETTDGPYYGHRIFQQKANLFEQDGNHAVLGSWIVGNRAAGMIIRDTPHMIVQDLSRVVPHWFV